MTEAEVSKEIKDYLLRREAEHPPTVIWFERLQSGHIEGKFGGHVHLCRPGTSDYVVVFMSENKRLILLFIECKSSDVKAEPRKGAQKAFVEKYGNRHTDVHYMIAQCWQQVAATIKSLSYNQVDSIDF